MLGRCNNLRNFRLIYEQKLLHQAFFYGGTRMRSLSPLHCSFQPQWHGLMLHKSTKTTVIFSPDKQHQFTCYGT